MTKYSEYLAGNPDLKRLDDVVYFVRERERIRIKKEAGEPAPWTEDLILSNYRFCNVHRRDDRVSRWIIKNIITEYSEHPYLWLMLTIGRWINWPPTLSDCIGIAELWPHDDSWNYKVFGDIIDERQRAGQKTWTGAYLITARTLPEGMGKGAWISERVLKPLWNNRGNLSPKFDAEDMSVQRAMKTFEGYFGMGTFMTGQIVADMTYSRYLHNAPDLREWAPIGPGSTRGLNRLYGRTLDKRIPQEQFNAELLEVMNTLELDVGDGIKFENLHDVQNVMCEMDKWWRAQAGGRPRSNYKPETAF